MIVIIYAPECIHNRVSVIEKMTISDYMIFFSTAKGKWGCWIWVKLKLRMLQTLSDCWRLLAHCCCYSSSCLLACSPASASASQQREVIGPMTTFSQSVSATTTDEGTNHEARIQRKRYPSHLVRLLLSCCRQQSTPVSHPGGTARAAIVLELG